LAILKRSKRKIKTLNNKAMIKVIKAYKIKAIPVGILKQQGYKQVKGYPCLYINKQGDIYNRETDKHLQPGNKNKIKYNNEYLSIPKLVLQAFAGQEYRTGQITYIDGNKTNIALQNIKYSCIFAPNQRNEVNKTDLLTAIRCYFPVEQKYKVKNIVITRMYLEIITEKRYFFNQKSDLKYIEVYKTFMSGFTNSIVNTAKEHGLSIRDCSNIVNGFTNILINEILHELKNGILHVCDFTPKKPTKTEITKRINKYLVASGATPLPLRKKSFKEKLKEFNKHSEEIKKQMDTV